MNDKFPTFNPESQTLENFLELINVSFIAAAITDEVRQVSIILTHIPTKYFDDVRALIAPRSISTLSLIELKAYLKQLFKPQQTIVKSLAEFQDRSKLKTESYNNFFKDLNRLAELCDFSNKEEFLKYKLFLAARNEPFFVVKLADFDYAASTVGDLLAQLSNLEAAYIDTNNVPSTVNKIKSTANKCTVCGRKNHLSEKCKYKDATCHKCGKKGHISPICKSDDNFSQSNSKDKKKNKPVSNTNVDQLQADDDSSSCEEASSLNTIVVNKLNKLSPIYLDCKLNNKKVQFEMDSGSPISTLCHKYCKEIDDCKILPCDLKLQCYNSSPVKVIGKITISDFSFRNKNVSNVDLVIVDDSCPNNLFGRDLISKFKLLDSNLNLNNIKVEELINSYKVDKSNPIKNFEARLYPKDNHKPSFQKARSVAFHFKPKIEESLNELIKNDILEKIEFSDYASPIVPVVKTNGSIRICGDFRKINQILYESVYPLPHMTDLVAKVSGHQVYSKIDLQNAYLQINVNDSDRKYLVINTHLGLFRYKRLPFGIHSSPAIFQKFIPQLLNDQEGCCPYLDDIIIYANSQEQHDKILSKVLEILQNVNVNINFKKSEFNKESINYLGFILSRNGYQPDPEKVKSIQNAPIPENQLQLKSFLGLTSFYHSFIKDFATIASPLYELTKKNLQFTWSNDAQNAFDKLKSKIIKKVILSKFDENAKIRVEVDASPVGVGAVLLQEHKNKEISTLAFASRKLSDAEKKYSQIDREALSIIFAINKFEKFLLGRRFLLRTDHRPLIHIFDPNSAISKIANARLLRWSLRLSAFQYDVEHLPGEYNKQADCLSRLPIKDKEVKFNTPGEYIKLLDVIDKFDIDSAKLKVATDKDTILSTVKHYVQIGFPKKEKDVDPIIANYFKYKDDLSIFDGLLTYRNRIVVPDCYRKDLMDMLHVGHAGSAAMKSHARSIIFWPNIDCDLDKITKNCSDCFQNHAPKGTVISRWPETEGPWQRIHTDWAGPLEGHYYLVIFDSKTKFLDVHCSKSLTASVTIDCLRKTFSNFGLPLEVVSDNGPCFIAKEFKSFLLSNKIKQTLVAPYHPQSNGAGERAVQTFKKLFSKFKNGNLSYRLARLLYHYRTTVQATTGKTPSELMFGRSFRTALDNLKPNVSWSKDYKYNENKFIIGEAIFAKNFGNGPEWIAGTIVDIINPLNYRIKFDCDINLVCTRHASQIFSRELMLSDTHDVPVIPLSGKSLIDNKAILENSPNDNQIGLNEPIRDNEVMNNSNDSGNADTSCVPDPVQDNVHDRSIGSTDQGTYTRSGRLSKIPDRLNL